MRSCASGAELAGRRSHATQGGLQRPTTEDETRSDRCGLHVGFLPTQTGAGEPAPVSLSWMSSSLRIDRDRAVDGGRGVDAGDRPRRVPTGCGRIGPGAGRVVAGDRSVRLSRASVTEVDLDVRGRRVGERGRLTHVRVVAARSVVVDRYRVAA